MTRCLLCPWLCPAHEHRAPRPRAQPEPARRARSRTPHGRPAARLRHEPAVTSADAQASRMPAPPRTAPGVAGAARQPPPAAAAAHRTQLPTGRAPAALTGGGPAASGERCSWRAAPAPRASAPPPGGPLRGGPTLRWPASPRGDDAAACSGCGQRPPRAGRLSSRSWTLGRAARRAARSAPRRPRRSRP